MIPRRPTVALTLGDPGGIGSEVIVKALADPALRARARFRIFGAAQPLLRAADLAWVKPAWTVVAPDDAASASDDVVLIDFVAGSQEAFVAQATRRGGELSFRFVEEAIAAAKLEVGDPRRVEAMVTGPISKAAWALADHDRFPGHTELLADRFGVKRFGMLFHVPGRGEWSTLNVIVATSHVPLMNLARLLTVERVCDAIELGAQSCHRLGIGMPRVAVCGLNPHAGEHGLLGDEEQRVITPAIAVARQRGVDARGPFPGDTVFNAAFAGEFDLVVAMYHDQGLIPVKLVARERAVNVTVGLPIVRTSPDHGTAFDIAGKNAADAGSMRSAIELAIKVCATAP